MKPAIARLHEPFIEALDFLLSRRTRQDALGTPLYANSAYLMANSALSAPFGFAFWVVAARLYGVQAVGIGAGLVSAAAFLISVASLGLGWGLIRFLSRSGNSASDLINSCFTLAGIAAIIVAAAFLAGLPVWSPALTFLLEKPVFVGAFVAFVAVGTIFSVMGDAFIALRRAEFALFQGLIQSLLKLALLVGMVSLFSVFGIFASWGLATAIAVVSGLVLFLPRVQPNYWPTPKLHRQVTNEMAHFSFANYVGMGFWSSPGALLPLMVVNRLGGEANAYFSVSWTMGALLFSIPWAVSNSLFAEGSQEESYLARDVKRSLKLVAVLLLPAIVVLAVAGDKLLLLFGEKYSLEGAKLLWILAPSAIPLSLNVVYLGIARVRKRLGDIILLAAAVALGTLVLGYVLIPYVGILGPGVGWLASQSLAALVVLPKILKVLK